MRAKASCQPFALRFSPRACGRAAFLGGAQGASINPDEKRLALRVEDHPLDYVTFEGVIPEGYGAGIVMLWDKGTWAPADDFADVEAALEKGELKFTLRGSKLKGEWVLVRTRIAPRRRRSGGDDEQSRWLLIKHRDGWAGPIDIDQFAPLSAKSGRDFAQILTDGKVGVRNLRHALRSGAAGAMLGRIAKEAAALRRESSA